MTAQKTRGTEVDLAIEETGQLILEGYEPETDSLPRQEFHEQIEVAVRTRLSACDRAEHRESSNAMSATEARELLVIEDKMVGGHCTTMIPQGADMAGHREGAASPRAALSFGACHRARALLRMRERILPRCEEPARMTAPQHPAQCRDRPAGVFWN